MPSESNPDALRKKRERGAEEGNQTLFNHQVDLSISKVRRSSVEKSNIKCEVEKGSSKARATTTTESRGRPYWRGPISLHQTWIRQITLDRSMAATGGEQAGESDLSGSESRGIHAGGAARRGGTRGGQEE